MQQKRSVFHDGERAVQARAEVSGELLKRVESFVRSEMPLQHRHFFENLQMLFLGLLDSGGRPWCVPALGPFPGFPHSGHTRDPPGPYSLV
jgi:predicted pyridoxine 5'-phosphate oxidase superfamily flavin-nucleotide-binding protein